MGIYLYANVRENLAHTKTSYLAFVRNAKKENSPIKYFFGRKKTLETDSEKDLRST